ncbi:MurR/RpiR family transcriptional regulator [Streptohalobacillus salinus]|uniref:MurR/RpiR family transcriptional regulator n=1 Tax=Streptohalobacillus salinus TaxID=621096 RepID=UPI000D76BD34|nr:MurR/RpiR family transcriptional regulator [Streptohalobacillus salinus]
MMTLAPSYLPTQQLEQFKQRYTKSETKIYQYLITHLEQVIYQSLTELSEQTGVAEATTLRFFKKIGYQGFQAFKLALAKEQTTETHASDDYVRHVHDNMIDVIQKSLHLVDRNTLEEVIDVIDAKTDVTVFAIGASAIAALDLQNRLMRIGKNITVITDSHTQIMRATSATNATVVIAISISGSTKEIIETTQIAKAKGATIIALTSYLKSPLTKHSDYVLLSNAKESPLDRGSLTAKVAQLYLIDLICTGITIKNQKQAERIKHEITENTTNKIY